MVSQLLDVAVGRKTWTHFARLRSDLLRSIGTEVTTLPAAARSLVAERETWRVACGGADDIIGDLHSELPD
jgi:hypothetical protein